MVGIQGLGGIPEPKPDRPQKVGTERGKETGASSKSAAGAAGGQDGLKISSEAQAAAEVARIVETTRTQDEIRADRVEAARQRLESGDYKRPDVVAQVAERIAKYI